MGEGPPTEARRLPAPGGSRAVVVVDDGGGVDASAVAALAVLLGPDRRVGVVSDDPAVAAESAAVDFVVPRSVLRMALEDPRQLTVAASLARCHPNELLVVARPGPITRLAESVGAEAAPIVGSGVVGAHDELASAVEEADERARTSAESVGVGPHPEPWPDTAHLDPELLAGGDRRNVVDRYRYWRHEAIVEDLDRRRRPFEVAVENWRHDRNIGAVVRNANAFGASAVHIVGRRRWNRRGAMSTDRYIDVRHHEGIEGLLSEARERQLEIVAVDNIDGAEALETAALPLRCLFVFGQEGPGVSEAVVSAADRVVAISQRGSTRSMNAGVASGIAMWAWSLRHPAPHDHHDPGLGERAVPS